MDEAARNAGILDDRDGVADTVLTFVSEPEAATLAILNEFDGAHGIKVSISSTHGAVPCSNLL